MDAAKGAAGKGPLGAPRIPRRTAAGSEFWGLGVTRALGGDVGARWCGARRVQFEKKKAQALNDEETETCNWTAVRVCCPSRRF